MADGIKLMLKGTRCETAKCPMEKPSRNMPPGQSRAFRRGQASEYGKRLREPGALTMAGEHIDLSRIVLPSYVCASREDHIVPWKAAYASARLMPGGGKAVCRTW